MGIGGRRGNNGKASGKKGGVVMYRCKVCKQPLCEECEWFRTAGVFNCIGCLNMGKT